ncbi:MAG: tetratricopeptide repeat protein [Planctomycetia bacterium]|nr:tetratricopeptide repeat protein [Planctomycetia bacterium]
MSKSIRTPLLHAIYHRYLVDQDSPGFSERVAKHYTVGTLERVAAAGDRMARRAAVLALGLLADYESNATLGRALHDCDRGVRILAENGIRALWCRTGNRQQRMHLNRVVELNTARRFKEAVDSATKLIEQAAWLAEGWNQRALALFNLGRFAESIHDCNQALELNPYHFGAATGMAQCHLQLKDRISALDCFRRALRLNPNLEGVRAHVLYLQRTLKSQE